jgi:hypothetical protein
VADQIAGDINIIPYNPALKAVWNQFNRKAINGLFLFDRDYMDYHQDRFRDHSLLFYQDFKLVALLPLHLSGDTAISHGGLTFGGLVISSRLKIHGYLEIFQTLLDYLRALDMNKFRYKPIPFIFHRYPALEDQYALFWFGAQLVSRGLSSCLDLQQKPALAKGRKWSLQRARKAGLELRESADFPGFMAMVEDILVNKYAVTPTHTAAELTALAGNFPDQIKLFAVYHQNQLIGGSVVYLYDRVVHLQYIATNALGKELHALDLVLDYLITTYRADHAYLNFGISPGPDEFGLMTNLIRNKESYGARSLPLDVYEFDLQTQTLR